MTFGPSGRKELRKAAPLWALRYNLKTEASWLPAFKKWPSTDGRSGKHNGAEGLRTGSEPGHPYEFALDRR